MNAPINLTAIMREEGIRSITMLPQIAGGDFRVILTCGGNPGYGETVGQALADAKARNAEWLGMAA